MNNFLLLAIIFISAAIGFLLAVGWTAFGGKRLFGIC